MGKWVEFSFNQGIAHIQLSRGGSNALNREYIEEIERVVQDVHALQDAQALVITASGSSFSVGGDVMHLVEHLQSLDDELSDMVDSLHSALKTISALPIPVVVGVHGGVGGGSLGFLWAADHVVAAHNTKIATGYVDIGLSSDGGNSWYLPRMVGVRRAKNLLLDNKVISAHQAQQWGLVDTLVAPNMLPQACLEWAAKMARRPSSSIQALKHLLSQSDVNELSDQLDLEKQLMTESAMSEDAQSRLRAFACRKNS